MSARAPRERRRLHVLGTVQGVGFRPFVHRLARRHELSGYVGNDGRGVVIEAEGDSRSLDALVVDLRERAPSVARVTAIESDPVAARGESGFRIVASPPGHGSADVAPDIATCDECLHELFDPRDRRHRYPFINCSQCGPRFTIVRATPYDRHNTTMAGFAICGACRSEYEDPCDRRFRAEPIACAECGPRLSVEPEALVEVLRGGGIVAIKGIGGFHLACDARDPGAVALLRKRKRREARPFAVMCADPHSLADPSSAELALLTGAERPIVLVSPREPGVVADGVCAGSPELGLMLPYSPLHHLLVEAFGGPLVMTSANLHGDPIAIEGSEFDRRLAGVADLVCDHDRPIERRCEDSVVRSDAVLRRSRGQAPRELPLPVAPARSLIGTGAQLANSFCVTRAGGAFVSAHLGDLDSPQTIEGYRRELALYVEMLGVEPTHVAHDMHPDYATTRWALERSRLEPVAVQHHHAHAAACMAEHGIASELLALVFDGTGYGTDGTLWGGELLRCDLTSFERLAALEPIPLPGGEAAVREPWRTAASYLERAGRPVPFPRWNLVGQSAALNAPRSSGAGRLFDAVSALLGICQRSTYEGQAAIELEWLAGRLEAAPYECRVEAGRIHGSDLVAAAHDDLEAGRERSQIAAAFHEGLALAAARVCEHWAAGERRVVLSGGCFNNRRLGASVTQQLRRRGLTALRHRRVPCGDGGISYGQAAVAAARLSACA